MKSKVKQIKSDHRTFMYSGCESKGGSTMAKLKMAPSAAEDNSKWIQVIRVTIMPT
jgi:hypothetical protein